MSFDVQEAQAVSRELYIEKMMNLYDERRIMLRGRKIDFLSTSQECFKDQLTNRNYTPAQVTAFFVSTQVSGLAGAGACIGALAGIPGGPPGMAIGAGVGAGIGALIGAATGSATAAYRLGYRYKEFLKTEGGKEFCNELRVFVDGNVVFDKMCCKIDYVPVIDGVLTPDGKLYERETLLRHIEKYGTNPGTNEKISINELKNAPGLNIDSLKQFVKFLEEKKEYTRSKAPHLMQGYDDLIKDIHDRFIYMYECEMKKLKNMFEDGLITYQEYTERRADISNKYLI